MTPPATEPGFEQDALAAAHPYTAPFWQAAKESVLLVPRCSACGRAHWYPRPFCPHCSDPRVEWQPASGLGVIEAFTAVLRGAAAPIVAYVRLDEGPVMLTNIEGCELDSLAIGQRVQVAFRAAPEGRLVPIFRPVSAPG